MKNKMKNKTRKRGGNVIASGGFGCIFEPSLECKNKTQKIRKSGFVSKLMLKKYAQKEYKEIQKYQKILETIPNSTDYFLVNGFTLCKNLSPLTESDLTNFNKKCKTLKKKDIDETNVNQSLEKLMSIQMPYGGIAVDDYIKNVKFQGKNMKELNASLISLLKNGVLPMNEAGLYHGDIKDSNVLVDVNTKKMYTRLIDWGLSCYYSGDITTEKKAPIPKEFTQRPFQFNLPFSIILFQKSFLKLYKSFLENNPNPDYLKIRSFVMNYVLYVVDKKGPGHIKNINSIMKQFFKGELMNVEEKFKDDLIEFEYTFYFVFEYLSKILFQYTRENEFQVMDYFENVFLKNVDVWGFVMIYISFTDFLFDLKEHRSLTTNEKKIIKVVKEVYVILIESSCEPIDVEKVIQKLESLEPLFSYAKKEMTGSKISKTSKNKTYKTTKNSSTSQKSSSSGKSLDSKSKSKSKSKTKKHFFTNLFS
jgi:hypothetical protein